MKDYLKTMLLLLATLPALLSEGAPKRVLQHRIYDQPGCGIAELQDPDSWKSPGQNNVGIISLSFDGINTQSMKDCLQTAARYWGATIQNRVPIHIKVSMLPELQDELALCDVVFYESTPTSITPSALHIQDTGEENNNDDPDANIWLNPAKQWDTTIGEVNFPEGISLYTCALRSIAVCLGFGSSVTSFDGVNPTFQWDGHLSKFDELIIDSSGKRLADCQTDDNALKSFVTPASGKSIYVCSQSPEYKMYSPATFRQRESLVYLDNPQSLMHYGIGTGDRNFKIDNVTASLMNQIGWGVPMNLDGQITCSNIDETGHGVALAPHTFKLKLNTPATIDTYFWELRLFNEDDETPVAYAKSTNSEFKVDGITKTEGYQELPGGELRAEVRLTVTINGQKYEVNPLSLKLSQEPYFSFVSPVNLQQSAEDGYKDIMFGVNCLGASEFSVIVTEWASSFYHVYTFETDGKLHIHAAIPHVDFSDLVEFEFIANNSYGTTTRTFTARPGRSFALLDYPFCLEDVKFELHDGNYESANSNYILVYDRNLKLVAKGQSYDSLVSSLPAGTYFFHHYAGGKLDDTQQVVINK